MNAASFAMTCVLKNVALMNALIEQLAILKLFGMAKRLIAAESTDRDVRRIRYQMKVAKFPHHKDLATFNYSASAIDREIIAPLCSDHFSETAHNIILIGGTGTGKTHTAIALGTELIQTGEKVRFYNLVDLINVLIREQAEAKQGALVRRLQMVDGLIIDELGSIPFPKSGGALLFHLVSKFYERTSVVMTISLDCGEWGRVCRNAKRTTALLDGLTHYCFIIETKNESYRFKQS